MPTERFYRLPEAKKQVIREAAIREFARVPFDKASINQIIQNADISRGSFYTYFEDKQDVVRYIFEENSRRLRECCEEELVRNHGDFFGLLEWLFEFTIRQLTESRELVQVVRNVFSYQENARAFGFELGCTPSLSELKPEENPVRWFYERINLEALSVRTEQELEPVVQLGLVSMLLAVRSYYQAPEQRDSIRKRYLASLEVLKYGVAAAGAAQEREAETGTRNGNRE